MSKHIFAFLLLVLLVLLAGCHSEETAQPTPTRYLTALEAYEQIRPAMRAWHEDAVVVYVSSVHSARSEWRVRTEGRSVWWSFAVYSPSVSKETDISFREGEISVGIPAIPGGEVSVYSVKEGLPLDNMIDSDKAVGIALQNGANGTLYYIGIDHYDSKTNRYIPPSWGLTYGHLHDWSQQQRVIIDAVTSEVLRSDFAE